MADLYTFTLVGGGVHRYSGGTTAITDTNRNLFALGPKFERSKTHVVIGVQVDELDVKIYPEPSDMLGSTPFLQAAWTGQFDGAVLQVERAFMWPSYGAVVGTVVMFAGRISDIDCSRTGIDMKCRSHLELSEYPDAAAVVAADLQPRFWRRNVPVRPGEPRRHLRGRVGHDADADRRRAEHLDAVHPGDDRRALRRQCRRDSHDRQFHVGAICPGKARVSRPACISATSFSCCRVATAALAPAPTRFRTRSISAGCRYIPAPENAV